MARRRFAVMALSALVLVGAVGPLADAHDASWRSSVTINYDGVRFHGKVRSAQEDCVPGRRVKVYHKIAGPDFFVGSDLTNAEGAWEVYFVPPAGETFYAKLKRRATLHDVYRHLCKGGRSPEITV